MQRCSDISSFLFTLSQVTLILDDFFFAVGIKKCILHYAIACIVLSRSVKSSFTEGPLFYGHTEIVRWEKEIVDI